MRRRGALGALGLLAATLLGPAGASAELGPIQLVSKSPVEQADSASATALSADGRYLVFQGVIGGRSGVFREDLASGALASVATALPSEVDGPVYASEPSISADGRYVSFTTSASLNPVDDSNGASDVYVADMATSPPRYELASARDGSALALAYEGEGGSRASGRAALSADGRKVVFFTTAPSDVGAAAGDTPAGQVLLRDLDTGRTTLVSVERDPATGAMTGSAVGGGAMIMNPALPLLRGAALSADGTTVAWLGAHLPAQVPLPAGEREAIEELDELGVTSYDEPLWRRVADGPEAPTRRIVGGADGPFTGMTGKFEGLSLAMGWLGVTNVEGVPQLSADGRTVALIGNPVDATNLFLVDMQAGLTRAQAVQQLTREIPVNSNETNHGINQEPNLQLNGHIFDLAISPDGQRLAFATARQQFPLAPPNLVTPPPGQLGLSELYLIDREGQTLQRVTHGTGGLGEASLSPSVTNGINGDGVRSPAFGAGGDLIAFASNASNLVAGDGNEASDAFTVAAGKSDLTPSASQISAGPRRRAKRPWRMTLSAFSLPHGGVRLVAIVPGRGTLFARASGTRPGVALASASPRILARGQRHAKQDGKLRLDLGLVRHLRRFAHTREGVYATVRAGFHRRGRKTLHATVQVRFHAHSARRGGGR
jgi:Tol biopolymer transport system component